jgi:hypothetical protein
MLWISDLLVLRILVTSQQERDHSTARPLHPQTLSTGCETASASSSALRADARGRPIAIVDRGTESLTMQRVCKCQKAQASSPERRAHPFCLVWLWAAWERKRVLTRQTQGTLERPWSEQCVLGKRARDSSQQTHSETQSATPKETEGAQDTYEEHGYKEKAVYCGAGLAHRSPQGKEIGGACFSRAFKQAKSGHWEYPRMSRDGL